MIKDKQICSNLTKIKKNIFAEGGATYIKNPIYIVCSVANNYTIKRKLRRHKKFLTNLCKCCW